MTKKRKENALLAKNDKIQVGWGGQGGVVVVVVVVVCLSAV